MTDSRIYKASHALFLLYLEEAVTAISTARAANPECDAAIVLAPFVELMMPLISRGSIGREFSRIKGMGKDEFARWLEKRVVPAVTADEHITVVNGKLFACGNEYKLSGYAQEQIVHKLIEVGNASVTAAELHEVLRACFATATVKHVYNHLNYLSNRLANLGIHVSLRRECGYGLALS